MSGLLTGTLEEQLDEFIRIAQKRPTGWNQWLGDEEGFEIYVRFSPKLQEDRRAWTLQLANISIPEDAPDKRRMIHLLKQAERYPGWLEIECLYNLRLVEFFDRRGYQRRPQRYGDLPVSLYRRPLATSNEN